MAEKCMALSTSSFTFKPDGNMLNYVFDNLSYNAFNTLIAQHAPKLSNSQMLSAPPFWRLQIDRPVNTPQTVGYNAFVALCQISQRVMPDNKRVVFNK
jgi:hypothetical protein